MIARNGRLDLRVSKIGRACYAPGWGLSFVSDASDIVDPIDLAQGEISRSKAAVASAAKDLDQHDRWLKDFLAAEKRDRARYARHLKREQARLRRQLKRQQMARSIRRAVLSVALFVRSVAESFSEGVKYAGRLVWTSAVWISGRTYTLSILLVKLLSFGLSWTWAKARAFAFASVRA